MRSKLKLVYVKSKNRFNKLGKNKQRVAMLASTLVFVAFGQIIISSFAATTAYSPIPAVAEMQKITEEVVLFADDYAKTPSTSTSKWGAKKANPAKAYKKQELIKLVEKRAGIFKKAVIYDPQTVANQYLPKETREKLPLEAKANVEEVKALQGTWASVATHAENNYEPEYFAYITDKENNDYYLFGKDLPAVPTGANIGIYGVKLKNFVALALPNNLLQPTQPTTPIVKENSLTPKVSAQVVDTGLPSKDEICESFIPAGPNTFCDDVLGGVVYCVDLREYCQISGKIDLSPESDTNRRKILVVPIHFSAEPIPDRPISELRELSQKVSSYYASASYSQFAPSFEVFDRYITADAASVANCDTGFASIITSMAVRSASKSAGIEDRIKEGQFTDVVYALNSPPKCYGFNDAYGSSGFAKVGTSTGRRYTGEAVVFMSYYYEEAKDPVPNEKNFVATTIAHEMGHTYGFGHAKSACKSGPNPDRCGDTEYGHVYNLMGSGGIGSDASDLSATQKIRVNWMSEDDLHNHEVNVGTYTLNALNMSTGKRVVKLNISGDDFFIEYRPKTTLSVNDRFQIGGKTPGLLTYKSSSNILSGETLELFGGKDGINNEGDSTYTYDFAGKLEPYKVQNGDEYVCVTPSNATQTSVTVKIENNCTNISEIAPVGSIGGEDSKGVPLPGVSATDPDVTQFNWNGTVCYDRTRNLLFVGDSYRILVYDEAGIKNNKASYVLGADTVNEYKSYKGPGWWLPQTYPKNFFMDAAYDTKTAIPNKAIDRVSSWMNCNTIDQKIYVGLSNGSELAGKIKVFDYINGIKSGMEPVAVLGQEEYSGTNNYDPPTASSMGGQNFSVFSNKRKLLLVADYQNARILGFDMSNGITNNMPAKYVAGQKDFVSREKTISGSFTPIYIAIDESEDEILVSGNYRFSPTSSNEYAILRYKLQDIINGKKEPYAKFFTPKGSNVREEPRGISFDIKDNRWLISTRNHIYAYDAGSADPNSPELLSTYAIDYSQYQEIGFAPSYDSETRKLFAPAINTGGFGRNHRNIFNIPPRNESDYYKPLGY